MKASSYVEQQRLVDQNCNLIKEDEDLFCTSIETLRPSSCDMQRENAIAHTLNPLRECTLSSVGAGFNLRKRSFNQSQKDVRLAGYNSAFLSGLFADIAKANDSYPIEEDSPMDDSSPVKKSRVTLSKSISRCVKSYANLTAAMKVPASPVSCMTNSPVAHVDSLCYQLHCVSSSSSNESGDIGKIAFPHLPATVSDSSCSQKAILTRRNSGQQRHEPENLGDSYGWFVNMDDDDTVIQSDSTSSLFDLAFSAATAPKSTCNHDAEVEWAKAADTVDDVLADFF